MRPMLILATALLLIAAALFSIGCQPAIMAGGDGTGGAMSDDPLAVPSALDKDSLDYLHREVVVRSCASTRGACHAGQFEPDMTTPARFYANLVNRPGIEHQRQLRVSPGAPDMSLVIDKLRNRNVSTRMPLGAPPLSEEVIAMFEQWISGGALRRPGAAPPEKLNNPPMPPEIGVFDVAGTRLDGTGPLQVSAGTELVLRHSVEDFEIEDPKMAYAGFYLSTADGKQVVLAPGTAYPDFGEASYDPAAPAGKQDLLDYRFTWKVPPTVGLRDDNGKVTQVASAGLKLTVIAYYADTEADDGIATFEIARDLIEVK
jgi:hypothetical protein